MLKEGEVALQAEVDLGPVNQAAHDLGLNAIAVVRSEGSRELQEQTVIAYAESLPLVWVAPEFSDSARKWARERGPMTLLNEADGPLDDEARRRIDRFVAILGRQSE